MGSFFLLASNPLRVVTTTTDLGDIVKQIGGDQVSVDSIAKPVQDPHFIDAKPSYIVKLLKADAFVLNGLDLELGWAPLLIRGSRNKKILPGALGYIDASLAINPIEIPINPTRADGDVHPGGNPHYMMDPNNGLLVAKYIADRLSQLKPEQNKFFESNLRTFEITLKKKMKQWATQMAGVKGTGVVTYHKNWSYFLNYFGLHQAGEIEPRPGITPTPSHLANLITSMREKKISRILLDPYFDPKLAEKISQETGAKILPVAQYVGAKQDIKNYFDLFDYNIKLLTHD